MTNEKTEPKISFREALMAEVNSAPGSMRTRCAICESPHRTEIEQAYKDGATFRLIGRTMQRISEMPANLSTGTIGDRVSLHFRSHMEDDHDK